MAKHQVEVLKRCCFGCVCDVMFMQWDVMFLKCMSRRHQSYLTWLSKASEFAIVCLRRGSTPLRRGVLGLKFGIGSMTARAMIWLSSVLESIIFPLMNVEERNRFGEDNYCIRVVCFLWPSHCVLWVEVIYPRYPAGFQRSRRGWRWGSLVEGHWDCESFWITKVIVLKSRRKVIVIESAWIYWTRWAWKLLSRDLL